MFKIACQTIVFPDIKERIEYIWKTVSEIGYEGAETGVRYLDTSRPDYYKELLQKYNLKLPAVHVGGDFLDKASRKQQMDNFDETVRFAKSLGCPFVYVSGVKRPDKTIEDYEYEGGVYNEMGKKCADAGLTFCYHNHSWEFENGLDGVEVMLSVTTPETMMLVPDVGWLTVAGFDPVKYLDAHFDRLAALHFKEFKFTPERTFTELGEGVVDFKGVISFLKAKGRPMWISIEQDKSYIGSEKSAKINLDYLTNLIG